MIDWSGDLTRHWNPSAEVAGSFAIPRPEVRRCETCNAECDALGHCLGSCQGEEWDR